jgi:acyl-CoA thioesterase FadM
MALTIELKACYADTDAEGVVSYAAHLRYLELARTECSGKPSLLEGKDDPLS